MLLTYRELKTALASLPDELLDRSVTVKVDDEFFGVVDFELSDEDNDVLDENTFTLIVDGNA